MNPGKVEFRKSLKEKGAPTQVPLLDSALVVGSLDDRRCAAVYIDRYTCDVRGTVGY